VDGKGKGLLKKTLSKVGAGGTPSVASASSTGVPARHSEQQS
jgi:hypothetical protein